MVGEFGLTICYDVRFPELYRSLAADTGAVVLLPASWGAGPGKREQWELLVRARALDSTSWVVACGQADPLASGMTPASKAPTGIGHSLVADPYGRVVDALDDAPGLLVVDVDPGARRNGAAGDPGAGQPAATLGPCRCPARSRSA